jgi:F1F0 ATPase subunit 2
MNEILLRIFAWFAGTLLGAIFFGGLWWTIRRGVSSRQPALWFLVSLMLRMSITLLGFYLVGRGHWQRLVLCLLGFVMARLAVTWLTRPRLHKLPSKAPEISHAH